MTGPSRDDVLSSHTLGVLGPSDNGMTEVYWLEQTEAEVPVSNDWLSVNEATCLSRLRFAKRRADWRLGRWTAKRALTAHLGLSTNSRALADLEIRPAPSGAPEAFLAARPAGVAISLSHRAGTALCFIAPSATALGCDLEMIEPHSDAFLADYFTPEEQALVARVPAADRPWLLAVLWSGKESALKALRAGLRLDTRCVTVSLGNVMPSSREDQGLPMAHPVLTFPPSTERSSWSPLEVRYAGGQVFHGWWGQLGSLVSTLVSNPSPTLPTLLTNQPDCVRDSTLKDGAYGRPA
jgi:4'-phosphopantetheinyl transferase